MKNLFLLFFLCVSTEMFSQIQRDTSYTAFTTYTKEKVNFPFIKIAQRNKKEEITELKDLVYSDANTRKLYLDAFIKKDDGLLPAVVMIHGGGWKSGDKSQMNLLAQEIASKGYVCFCVEYRLADEAKYPSGIIDIKTAIQYIRHNAQKFNIDDTKIAVLGCSSGGQMAALIGTTNKNAKFESVNVFNQSSDVQAIIDMDGILAFHHTESKEGKAASLWLGGDYQNNSEIWEEASALNHCNSQTPPILFINSELPRFHAGRDDMIKKLNQFGIYSEIKTISNSPHSFWFFDPWLDEIVQTATQFLDKIFKTQ